LSALCSNACDVLRSMLRVVVDDGEATATFELPDYLLQGITSLSYNHLVRRVVYLIYYLYLLVNEYFLSPYWSYVFVFGFVRVSNML
jgi:hypothetical protein